MVAERGLRRMLTRWPARFSLPLLLSALCAAALLLLFNLRGEQALAHARMDMQQDLAELASLTARRLDSYAELGDSEGARGIVTRLGLYGSVAEAWQLDAQGRILHSLRRSDTGLALDDVRRRLPPALDVLLGSLPAAAAEEIATQANAAFRLQVEPVLARSDPPERGLLVLIGDSTQAEAEARWNLRRVFRTEALILTLAAIFAWWWLRLQLLDRSARLQSAAEALRSGHIPQSSEVGGRDELGAIGHALDAGFERLRRHQAIQQLALASSRSLVEERPLPERLQTVCELLVRSRGFRAARILAEDPDATPLCGAGHLPEPTTASAAPASWRFSLQLLSIGDLLEPAVLEVWPDDTGEGQDEWKPALEVLARDLEQQIARLRAEHAKRSAERRERLAMDAAELGAWQLELSPLRIRLSARAAAMLGATELGLEAQIDTHAAAAASIEFGEARGVASNPLSLLGRLLHPDDAQRLQARLRPGETCPSLLDEEFRVRRDGDYRWLLGRGTVVERDAGGHPRALAGVLIDIDARKRAESALRLASEVFESSQLGILICSAEGLIIDVNSAFESITGYPREQVLGRPPSLLSSGHHPPEFFRGMWAELLARGRWDGEIWNRRADGSVYPQWLTITRVDDVEGQPLHYIGQFVETSDRKAFESRIEYLGAHDLLTGLPRRERLMQALQAELQACGSTVVLMHVDIDRFRQINESLGYAAGDLLLRAVPARLARVLPAEAWVSRISADEFLVLVAAAGPAEAQPLAARVHDALCEPIEIDGRELVLGISVGYAIGPQDAADAERLAAAAELALGAAQLSGRNLVQAFRSEFTGRSLQALTLESEMRAGLQRAEFFVVYQAQLDLRTDALAGYEALVRWQHPQRGLISPADFIPLAEDTGLIVPLGEFVLREACAATMRLRARGLPAVPVSVNVSTLQFKREDFEATVEAALADSGLPPEALELELTESVLMDHAEAVLRRLDRLRARGLKLAIDDFGTGFSSLAYLGRLRPDRLKIDQSFVRGMGRSVTSQGVVKAILALSEEFGLATVAEGVETQEEAAVLRALGCDAGQGYLFARPQEELLLRWPLEPPAQA